MRPRRAPLARLLSVLAALAALAGSSALGACGWLTGPDAPDAPLAISVGEGEVRVANRSARPVHTFVVDHERLGLIFWAPCVDPVHCPALAPGAVDTTRFDAATNGLRPGRDAAVVWWFARRTPAGLVPDSVHTVIVPL